MRPYSFSDQCIALLDTAIQTVFPEPKRATPRENPGTDIPEHSLTSRQKQHAAGLMRVNHAGEVSAQALYQGQALVARKEAIREHLQHAAAEEVDHLAWCEQRLSELESTTSLLNPLWYSASFVIGALAGLAGLSFFSGLRFSATLPLGVMYFRTAGALSPRILATNGGDT